jgi:hypothetical protein
LKGRVGGDTSTTPTAAPVKSIKKKHKASAVGDGSEEDLGSLGSTKDWISCPVDNSTLTQQAKATLRDHIDTDDGLKPLIFHWVNQERIRGVCIYDLFNGSCTNPNCKLASSHGNKRNETTLLQSFKEFVIKN